MAHDVFISHSHEDKPAADAACAALEARGIRCWIAPRDIDPGQDWAASIVAAIRGAQIMLLVFSRHANQSPQVKREVERAANSGKVLLPLRIDDVLPEDALEYYLSTPHWLDAITKPFEAHLEKLADACTSLLAVTGRSPQAATSPIAGLSPSPRVTADPARDVHIPAADHRPRAGGFGSATTQPRPPDRPPTARPRSADRQTAKRDTSPPSWRRRWQLVTGAAVILIAAILALAGYLLRPPSPASQPLTAEPAAPSGQPAPPTGRTVAPTPVVGQTVAPATAAGQTQLPFAGLTGASGLAVNGAGDVYVADAGNGRVLELAVGSSSPTTMSFTGLGNPSGVAVDAAGDVYVTNTANNRVLKLAAGSTSTTELPFTDLTGPRGVATDTAGDVYVSGGTNNRVLKLAAGSSNTTEPPFTGLSNPGGLAADGAGDVYVADTGNNRVLKLAAGAATPTVLPVTGLSNPAGVAVDGAGDVYVADTGNNRVLRLAAG
jgi:serine/threonine protein kinase, bacterial